jgi:hypothetical protein
MGRGMACLPPQLKQDCRCAMALFKQHDIGHGLRPMSKFRHFE